jgi:hypothetical protein
VDGLVERVKIGGWIVENSFGDVDTSDAQLDQTVGGERNEVGWLLGRLVVAWIVELVMRPREHLPKLDSELGSSELADGQSVGEVEGRRHRFVDRLRVSLGKLATMRVEHIGECFRRRLDGDELAVDELVTRTVERHLRHLDRAREVRGSSREVARSTSSCGAARACLLALHRRFRRTTSVARHLVEHSFSRVTAHDSICNRVCVVFVTITHRADAAVELNTSALLDHVRGFVRREVDVGTIRERDVVARRVRTGADLRRGVGSVAADMSANAGHVVSAEAGLNLIAVRKRLARSLHARGRNARDLLGR